VASEEWANLREEDGLGGGSGKVGRRWKIKDTSRMGTGVYNRSAATKTRLADEASLRMKTVNPSQRPGFVQSTAQKDSSRRCNAIRTEASRKKVRAIYPDGTVKTFESKRAACQNIGISYDVLNYRIDKDLDYEGIRFQSVSKQHQIKIEQSET
jgi:hypothetical protein